MENSKLSLYVGILIGLGIVLINFILIFSNLSASSHMYVSYLTVPIIIGAVIYLAYRLGKQVVGLTLAILHTIKALYIGLAFGLASLWLLTWIQLDNVLGKDVYITLAGVNRSEKIQSLIAQYLVDATSSIAVSTVLTLIISSVIYKIGSQHKK